MKDPLLFSKSSTGYRIQPAAHSLAIQQSRCAVVYRLPSCAEAKNGLRCTSTLPYAYTTCPEASLSFTFLRPKYSKLIRSVSQRVWRQSQSSTNLLTRQATYV